VPSLFARLFGARRMPAELSAYADRPDVLVRADRVGLKFSSRGLGVPGRYTSRGVRLHRGALVVGRDRIGMSIGRRVVLDAQYSTARTPLSVQVSPDGVHVHLDVGAAVPDGKGTLDITARLTTPGATDEVRHVVVTAVEAGWLARLG
jgi:hypothetical protein